MAMLLPCTKAPESGLDGDAGAGVIGAGEEPGAMDGPIGAGGEAGISGAIPGAGGVLMDGIGVIMASGDIVGDEIGGGDMVGATVGVDVAAGGDDMEEGGSEVIGGKLTGA